MNTTTWEKTIAIKLINNIRMCFSSVQSQTGSNIFVTGHMIESDATTCK